MTNPFDPSKFFFTEDMDENLDGDMVLSGHYVQCLERDCRFETRIHDQETLFELISVCLDHQLTHPQPTSKENQ